MFLKKVFGKKQRKVVIVQCRLSSTRLPRKALLPLGGKTVLEWVLLSMKQVKADAYYLATDFESETELLPVAKKMGWKIYAGSKTDVLQRFIEVINISKADIVLRGTADNPFLFYEAAQDLLDDFVKRSEGESEKESADYMTYTGLPHGSGVEVFNAHSLIRAAEQTDLPYDHEHVGPALYNHPEKFECLFIKASEKYNFPELRSTIDTAFDFKRAQQVVDFLSGDSAVTKSYSVEEIIDALNQPHIKNQVLLIPSVEKGHGTGHLRRCLDIAVENKNDIYIPLEASLEQTAELVKEARTKGLKDFQIIRNLSDVENYSLVVTDLFKTETEFAKALETKTSVLSIDDGNENTVWADYLLNVIPTVKNKKCVNLTNHSFMNLPVNVRNDVEKNAAVHNSIVVFGGEDPADLTLKASLALAENNIFVTAVFSSEEKIESARNKIPANLEKFIKPVLPVENLKEQLYKYDLVITHFGFTAFEAARANCHIILVAPTELHKELSISNDFVCINPDEFNSGKISSLLKNPEKLFKPLDESEEQNLSHFIRKLATGNKKTCPVCHGKESFNDSVVSRTSKRTFRRCSNCDFIYMSWSVQEEETKYNHEYFFEDYQKQYGKTYLDDFNSIKAQGIRRISLIDYLYRKKNKSVSPAILDIGCAMGPFLDAASTAMWQVFGTDICQEAVDYVQNTLSYPAVCGMFPDGNLTEQFGVDQFDAVTMWFVIEHFTDLDVVLKAVNGLVKKNGIFAFSTPSASGVSGKYNKDSFYEHSPQDHYSIWEPEKAAGVLRKYGFEVVKIVPTGIHPERFPGAIKHKWSDKSIQMKALRLKSRLLKLGDTFEVYCRKI